MLDRLNKTEVVDYLNKYKGTVALGFNIELISQYNLPNKCKSKKYIVLDNNTTLFGEKESLIFFVVDQLDAKTSKRVGVVSRIELLLEGVSYNLPLMDGSNYNLGASLINRFISSMDIKVKQKKQNVIQKMFNNFIFGR